jgi:hypothetical protein
MAKQNGRETQNRAGENVGRYGILEVIRIDIVRTQFSIICVNSTKGM